LDKLENRHKYERAIIKWRENISAIKRSNYIKNFLENNEKYKQIQLKGKIFEGLKIHTKNLK